MTTVPGTCFTKEQLEADLKVDDVSDEDHTGSDRMRYIGYVYYINKNQYDKALAWFILAAMGNNPIAQSSIGGLYYYGQGVPKNYLCALKWFLKPSEQNGYENALNTIGNLFENGDGVPLDKYKALEWFCHGGSKYFRERLEYQGYHLSASDQKKSLEQLVKETNAILETEKKKLEDKQDKTQEEIEALVDLNITYKLTGGSQNAWKGVPVLFIDDKKRYTESLNSSATNKDQDILELMKQIQLLKQERNTFESQAEQLQSLKQEESNLQRQIKEQDKELALLRNDKQSPQRGNSTVQQQMKTKDDKIASLQRENQELQLKTNNLEQQVREKDSKINVLENEQHGYHRTSIQQTQMLNLLKQDKQVMEQDKTNTANEMERLKSSYAILEQLLKAKEDAIMSLKRENQTLSTANQGNQQGANDMVETLKNLLQAKASETELLKQNTEHLLANEQRRIDALEQEIRALKQERTQQQATIQNTGPSNVNSTNSNPSHHDHHDESYNDLNYESEYSDTEESDGDDINYDTPSENEDSNNDLNYDDVNESNK